MQKLERRKVIGILFPGAPEQASGRISRRVSNQFASGLQFVFFMFGRALGLLDGQVDLEFLPFELKLRFGQRNLAFAKLQLLKTCNPEGGVAKRLITLPGGKLKCPMSQRVGGSSLQEGSVLGIKMTSPGEPEIVGAPVDLGAFLKTAERSDMGFDVESVRRRRGYFFEDLTDREDLQPSE